MFQFRRDVNAAIQARVRQRCLSSVAHQCIDDVISVVAGEYFASIAREAHAEETVLLHQEREREKQLAEKAKQEAEKAARLKAAKEAKLSKDARRASDAKRRRSSLAKKRKYVAVCGHDQCVVVIIVHKNRKSYVLVSYSCSFLIIVTRPSSLFTQLSSTILSKESATQTLDSWS